MWLFLLKSEKKTKINILSCCEPVRLTCLKGGYLATPLLLIQIMNDAHKLDQNQTVLPSGFQSSGFRDDMRSFPTFRRFAASPFCSRRQSASAEYKYWNKISFFHCVGSFHVTASCQSLTIPDTHMKKWWVSEMKNASQTGLSSRCLFTWASVSPDGSWLQVLLSDVSVTFLSEAAGESNVNVKKKLLAPKQAWWNCTQICRYNHIYYKGAIFIYSEICVAKTNLIVGFIKWR